jgi:hypothetical protein
MEKTSRKDVDERSLGHRIDSLALEDPHRQSGSQLHQTF